MSKQENGAAPAITAGQFKNGVRGPDGRQMVPIEWVRADPAKNARRRPASQEELEELGESLKAGQLEPCLGVEVKGGYVELVTGFRRLAAARVANIKALWVEGWSGDLTDDVNRMLDNLTENTARLNLTPPEKARAYFSVFQAMVEGTPGLSRNKVYLTIAARTGVSKAEVVNYVAMADKLSGKVMKAWELAAPGQVPTKWLQSIVGEPHEVQDARLDQLLSGRAPADVGANGHAPSHAAAVEASPADGMPGAPAPLTAEQRAAAKASRNPGAPPRVTKSRIQTELAVIRAGTYAVEGTVDLPVPEKVSPSGKLSADWLAGAAYAMEFALSQRAFNPLGRKDDKRPGKKGKGKAAAKGGGKKAKSGKEGVPAPAAGEQAALPIEAPATRAATDSRAGA